MPPPPWLPLPPQVRPEELTRQFRRKFTLPLSQLAQSTITHVATTSTTSSAQTQLEELASALERVIDATDEVLKKRRGGRTWVDELAASVVASAALWRRGLLREGDRGGEDEGVGRLSEDLAANDLKSLAEELQEEVGGLGMWLNDIGYVDGLPPSLSSLSREISLRIVEPLKRWKIRYHMGDDDEPVGFRSYVSVLREIAGRVDDELEGVYQLFASMDTLDTSPVSSEDSSILTPVASTTAIGTGAGAGVSIATATSEDDDDDDDDDEQREIEVVDKEAMDTTEEDDLGFEEDDDDDDEELHRGRSRSPRWGITSAGNGNGTRDRRRAKGGEKKKRSFFGFGFSGSGFESPGYSTPGDAGVDNVVPKGGGGSWSGKVMDDLVVGEDKERVIGGNGKGCAEDQPKQETEGKSVNRNGIGSSTALDKETDVAGVPVIRCTDENGMKTKGIVGWDTPELVPSPSCHVSATPSPAPAPVEEPPADETILVTEQPDQQSRDITSHSSRFLPSTVHEHIITSNGFDPEPKTPVSHNFSAVGDSPASTSNSRAITDERREDNTIVVEEDNNDGVSMTQTIYQTRRTPVSMLRERPRSPASVPREEQRDEYRGSEAGPEVVEGGDVIMVEEGDGMSTRRTFYGYKMPVDEPARPGSREEERPPATRDVMTGRREHGQPGSRPESNHPRSETMVESAVPAPGPDTNGIACDDIPTHTPHTTDSPITSHESQPKILPEQPNPPTTPPKNSPPLPSLSTTSSPTATYGGPGIKPTGSGSGVAPFISAPVTSTSTAMVVASGDDVSMPDGDDGGAKTRAVQIISAVKSLDEGDDEKCDGRGYQRGNETVVDEGKNMDVPRVELNDDWDSASAATAAGGGEAETKTQTGMEGENLKITTSSTVGDDEDVKSQSGLDVRTKPEFRLVSDDEEGG